MLTVKLTQQSRAQTGELENLDSDPASVSVMLRKLFNLLVTQVPQLENWVIVLALRVPRKIKN